MRERRIILQCIAERLLQRGDLTVPSGLKRIESRISESVSRVVIVAPRRALTSEVTPEHKVKHEKAILVVLESIT